MLREVGSLISFHDDSASFIETPAGDIAAELLGKQPRELEAGHQIAYYKVLSSLGAGGMGHVYLAEDTRLGRRIALKVLPAQFTTDAERISRFDQEARAASALNHPNIVTIHEIGRADSTHFIATEYIEGETLREHLAGREVRLNEVLDIGLQVASALAAAHRAGIVHRDIKPENIMLRDDGIVKVLDFGLAKLAASQLLVVDKNPRRSVVKSNPGVVIGTVQYMSPEQARGQDVDARTDVWSLGVVLYEMITGRAPFKGETPSHVIVSILERDPHPLAGNSDLPLELERIVISAMRKDRAERYQTASELARDLKSLKQEIEVDAVLKRSLEADTDTGELTRSDGRAGIASLQESATPAADVATGRPRWGAQYVINEMKRKKLAAAIAAAVLIAAAALAYYFYPRSSGEAIDSVAVLPFVNTAGDPNTEYLSDGISDSIINSLSRLPNLKVISLNAASRYKGTQVDPQAIGRELRVQAVLMGRMTQRGDTLAISAELIDVRDNRRLWGEHYNRKPSDILAIQQEIATEMAGKLRLRLDSAEKQELTKRYTESTDAYGFYLRGRFMLEKRTGPAIYKSIEYLEQAIKLDPNYALAYATLSYAYWTLQTGLVGLPKEAVLPKARAAVEKALEIDDSLAEAYTALGHVRQSERDLTGAESAFKRGLELNPNSGFVHSNYSHFLRDMGRIDEAVAESKRAVELEPASVLYNRNVAMNLYYARRYDEAIEQSLKTLELDPNMITAYRWLARSYEQKKLYDQAVEAYLRTAEFGPEVEAAFREAYATSGWTGFWRKSLVLKKERAKQGNISLNALAETYVRIGEKAQAFALREKANITLYGTDLLNDPFWDDLRSDPRYLDLVRRLGLGQ